MELTHYYAQIGDTGTVQAITQAASEIDAGHMIAIGAYDLDLIGQHYNAQTGAFEPVTLPIEPALRRLSVLAFRRRFTLAERAAIEWAAVDRSDQSTEQRQQAAQVRVMLADQAAARYIDLQDAGTVAGVQALQALGLLTLARAAAILSAPVQPEELP